MLDSPEHQGLRIAAPRARPLSRKQQRFNRLTKKVAQLKTSLQAIEPPRKLTANQVLARLRDDLRIVEWDVARARRDLESFADIRALKTFPRAQPQSH